MTPEEKPTVERTGPWSWRVWFKLPPGVDREVFTAEVERELNRRASERLGEIVEEWERKLLEGGLPGEPTYVHYTARQTATEEPTP